MTRFDFAVRKMAGGSVHGTARVATPRARHQQAVVPLSPVPDEPVETCATEFVPVTLSRGLSLSASTSVPIVDGAYIYQSKSVSGANRIRRWDWDTFANETTAYTATQRLPGSPLFGQPAATRSVTADASYIYWVEAESTVGSGTEYYQKRVMKADHSFGSVTVLASDTTTVASATTGDEYAYTQIVRSPTNGDLVLTYTYLTTPGVFSSSRTKIDIIDSATGARTNIRDVSSLVSVLSYQMVYTPDGALWGQDRNDHYWRMVSGTITDLGSPFGSDHANYLAPTPDNTVLIAKFDSGFTYVDQYVMDSSGAVTVATCDYGTVLADMRRFIGWSPDVSTIGFGGLDSGFVTSRFYRWG